MPNDLIERQAFWHIFLGDNDLLTILQPEDFADRFHQTLFVVCQETYRESHLRVDLLMLDRRLEGRPGYPGFAYLMGILEMSILSDHLTLVKLLREIRAQREAKAFKQDGPAEEIPQGFIRKGHEIAQMLSFDSRPMKTLAEKLQRVPEVFPSGFPTMDRMLNGGLELGGVFVIAARPSVGKTTMGINIAAHAVQNAQKVFFLSLEMQETKIAERALCHLYQETVSSVRKNAGDMLSTLPGEIVIEDRKTTLPGVQAAIMQHADADLIVIDYFQLITVQSRENRQTQFEDISRAIKLTAMEIKKPVILLAQLNREIERDRKNREPEFSDLRGTGALEQDADVVTFLWDENAKEDGKFTDAFEQFGGQKSTKRIKWIIRKNRNGATGTVDLTFRPETFSFAEDIP